MENQFLIFLNYIDMLINNLEHTDRTVQQTIVVMLVSGFACTDETEQLTIVVMLRNVLVTQPRQKT